MNVIFEKTKHRDYAIIPTIMFGNILMKVSDTLNYTLCTKTYVLSFYFLKWMFCIGLETDKQFKQLKKVFNRPVKTK